MGAVLVILGVARVLQVKDLFLSAIFAPQRDGMPLGRVGILTVIDKSLDTVGLAISGVEGGMRQVEADIEDTDDDTLACKGLCETCS